MELLTPNELSRILKLHPFTVTRLAREGKLPAFKVGGSWRFQKDEFERWVESKDSTHRSRSAARDHKPSRKRRGSHER